MNEEVTNIKEKYEERGLDRYRLIHVSDLKEIHGVDIEKIKGFTRFCKRDREMLKTFLVNFYNASGIEERINLKPVGFGVTNEAQPRIKFTVEKRGKSSWYRIYNARLWG